MVFWHIFGLITNSLLAGILLLIIISSIVSYYKNKKRD